MNFVTKIYHPNVLQKDGSICEQIFGNPWSPQTKILDGKFRIIAFQSININTLLIVLLIIKNMLITPNIDSPLEQDVANQYSTNLSAFNKTAKEWTKKYATKK